MKRKFTYIILLLIICLLSGISGCQGPQYKESEVDDMEEQGKKLMQEWLDEHFPGAEVLTASAYIEKIMHGPENLTDSVYGTFSYDGEEQVYEVEVEEKEVYLPGDMGFLTERVESFALESLGLSGLEDGYGFDGGSACILSVGAGQYIYGGHSFEYYDTGLIPGEIALKLKEADPDSAAAFKALMAVTDKDREDADRIPWNDKACVIMDEFIRNKENRPFINISGLINAPVEIELKDYDMAFFDSIQETTGLNYSYVYLCQDFEDHREDPLAPENIGAISAKVTCSGGDTSYERYVRKPFEDFYIEFNEEYYREVSQGGEVTLKEQQKNDAEDLRMDRTKEGYSFSFADDDGFRFYIITDGSSELFSHEYINRFDQEFNSDSGKYVGGRYIDREIKWGRRDDGLWTLMDPDGFTVRLSNANELVIKDE